MPKRKQSKPASQKSSAVKLALLGLVLVFIAIFIVNRNNTTSGDPVVINNTAVAPLPAIRAEMAAEGERLYMQHCAGCHGTELQGAPNWKVRLEDGSYPPPPQDDSGHTWHHSDQLLVEIIRNGGDPASNSAMPAFGEILSEEEILSILEFFKSTWGKEAREFQWWVSVRPE